MKLGSVDVSQRLYMGPDRKKYLTPDVKGASESDIIAPMPFLHSHYRSSGKKCTRDGEWERLCGPDIVRCRKKVFFFTVIVDFQFL